jgi:aryl-alcohol dehydrogenase-like predicted oxidoreductase
VERLFYALDDASTAVDAAQMLVSTLSPDVPYPRAAVENAVVCLLNAPSAKVARAVLPLVLPDSSGWVTDALVRALALPFASVREPLVVELTHRLGKDVLPVLLPLLASDPAWIVRQAVLKAVATLPLDTPCWEVLVACDDPHWRVRNDLVQLLVQWTEKEPSLHDELFTRLTAFSGPEADGMVHYLRYRLASADQRRTMNPVAHLPPVGLPLPAEDASWWSDDPPQLYRRLQELTRQERVDALPALASLVHYDHKGVRRFVHQCLLQHAGPAHLLPMMVRADDRREPFLWEACRKLLAALHDGKKEALCTLILDIVIDEASPLFDVDEVSFVLEWFVAQPLGTWWLDDEESRERLFCAVMRLAEHPREQVVCAVLDALAGWSAHEALEALLPLLEPVVGPLLRHPSQRISFAALRAAAHLWPAKPLAPWFLQPEATEEWKQSCAAFWLEDGLSFAEQQRVWLELADSSLFRSRWLAAQALSHPMAASQCSVAPLLEALQTADEPWIRAAALTPERAEWLAAHPTEEPAWLVRKQAATLLRRTALQVFPVVAEDRPQVRRKGPQDESMGPDAPLSFVMPQRWPAAPPAKPEGPVRPLGQTGLWVSPLGISGHYGLPEDGYARAIDAGVNLFFWEPNYHAQTRFFGQLTADQKDSLVTVCGTFEAEPKAILRDLENALRMQSLEQIKVWMMFWVRDWGRLGDDVVGLLEDCKRQGKIHAYGMSSHLRPLACRAIEEEWDVVMVRHNAAHKGAETSVFPLAKERGVGLFTFNNLMYGRMLHRPYHGACEPPLPSECYRYSLFQPGVSATWSSPRNAGELAHNLEVLEAGPLPAEREQAMRAFGEQVYLESKMFAECVRYRGWRT